MDWLDPKKLVSIVEMASQIILQVYYSDDFDIKNKNDNSPLTIADQKANRYICEELLKYYPKINIISEENKNEDFNERKKYEWAWLVDPLDGTKEFIKKNGEFTVNIGLIHNGEPVAGFVNIPVDGKTYFAIKGKGAWLKYKDVITNLEDIRFDNAERSKKVIASRSHMNDATREFLNQIGNPEIVSVGSSIKILWIADNTADIYPRIAPTMEWDTCAAHAILREIGGKMLIYPEMEKELTYNKENLLNPYFVAQFLDFK